MVIYWSNELDIVTNLAEMAIQEEHTASFECVYA